MAPSKKFIIRDRLWQLLVERRLGESGKLPPVRELCGVLGASLRTVHEAVQLLKEEGLVESRGRTGNFVCKPVSQEQRVAIVGPGIRDSYMQTGPSSWPGTVCHPLRQALAAAGYTVEVFSLRPATCVETFTALRAFRPSAVVLFEMHCDFWIADFLSLQVPLISLDHDASALGIPSVSLDNIVGTFDMTQRLIAAGHRRIAYCHPAAHARYYRLGALDPHHEVVALAQGREVIDERWIGVRLAAHQAGLTAVRCEVSNGVPLPNSLFEGADRITAFVGYNSGMAERCHRELRSRGSAIPRDAVVTSFGAVPCRIDGSSIPTVCFSPAEMGVAGARLITEPVSDPQLLRIPTCLQHVGETDIPSI